MPDGPFILSNHPGSGSEKVHPTAKQRVTSFYLLTIAFKNNVSNALKFSRKCHRILKIVRFGVTIKFISV